MTIFLACLLIGIVAGLRAMLAPTVVSWAAWAGLLDLSHTWFAFLGYAYTPWIFTIAALGELITDQLPTTPSRKVPAQFGARIVMGGFSGAMVGLAADNWAIGLILGIVGAVFGTIFGAAGRARMAGALGSDHVAAVIEDLVAIAGAFLVMWALA